MRSTQFRKQESCLIRLVSVYTLLISDYAVRIHIVCTLKKTLYSVACYHKLSLEHAYTSQAEICVMIYILVFVLPPLIRRQKVKSNMFYIFIVRVNLLYFI